MIGTNLNIVLDLFQPADASVLLAGDHDPEHRRRFNFPPDFVPSLQHSQNVIARWRQERRDGTRFPFAVRDAASGELLGGCELRPINEKVANISYWTYPPHRRRGVASRAVGLLCALAFEQFNFCRLEIVTNPDNVASRAIAVGNGFTETGLREGHLLFVVNREGPTKKASA